MGQVTSPHFSVASRSTNRNERQVEGVASSTTGSVAKAFDGLSSTFSKIAKEIFSWVWPTIALASIFDFAAFAAGGYVLGASAFLINFPPSLITALIVVAVVKSLSYCLCNTSFTVDSDSAHFQTPEGPGNPGSRVRFLFPAGGIAVLPPALSGSNALTSTYEAGVASFTRRTPSPKRHVAGGDLDGVAGPPATGTSMAALLASRTEGVMHPPASSYSPRRHVAGGVAPPSARAPSLERHEAGSDLSSFGESAHALSFPPPEGFSSPTLTPGLAMPPSSPKRQEASGDAGKLTPALGLRSLFGAGDQTVLRTAAPAARGLAGAATGDDRPAAATAVRTLFHVPETPGEEGVVTAHAATGPTISSLLASPRHVAGGDTEEGDIVPGAAQSARALSASRHAAGGGGAGKSEAFSAAAPAPGTVTNKVGKRRERGGKG